MADGNPANGQNGEQQPGAQPAPQANPVFVQMMGMFQNMMLQMQQQSAAMLRQQQDFMRTIETSRQVPVQLEKIIDLLASNIKEFRYDAESCLTFAAWYSRYEDLFEQDAARLEDDAKVRLLLRKLGMAEHERYSSFILPAKPKAMTFEDTVNTLKGLFGATESVVSKRYRCLQNVKQPTEDHVTYACRVNKLCVEFELAKLTEDQFKCLVYFCGLKSENDAEIRTRLLSKIEEQDVTLQQLSDECQRLLNLKHDNAMIESQPSLVNKVQQQWEDRGRGIGKAQQQWANRGRGHDKQQQQLDRGRDKKQDRSSSPSPVRSTKGRNRWACWLCGGLHKARNCEYQDYRCADCNKIGHREGYCRSSESFYHGREKKTEAVSSNVVTTSRAWQKGRKFVSVGLDGTPVQLQLDTASDITVINKQLWKKIGRPKLSAPSVRVTTATGSSLTLVGEFFCDVTIAGSTQYEVIRVTEKPVQLLGLDLLDSFDLGSVSADSFCCNALWSTEREAKWKVEETDPVPRGEQQRTRKKHLDFVCDDLVYALVRSRRSSKWMSGFVLENYKDGTYNVWLRDGRLLRCHTNQMRGSPVAKQVPPLSSGRC